MVVSITLKSTHFDFRDKGVLNINEIEVNRVAMKRATLFEKEMT